MNQSGKIKVFFGSLIVGLGFIIEWGSKVAGLLNDGCTWGASKNLYPAYFCSKKSEDRMPASPPDLLPRFQEIDLPNYQINYLYYDVKNKQWTDNEIMTNQEIVVRKPNFRLLDHQTDYQSTIERLNNEISKSMAHAQPVIDYFGTCMTHEKPAPRIDNIDNIEARIASIVENLHTEIEPDGGDANLVDAGEPTDAQINKQFNPTLIIDTAITLNQHGIISILLEFKRDCMQLDGGRTIFRDAINVNLALPESERFEFYKIDDLAPTFRDCHDKEKVAVFSVTGYLLCYARSETLNSERPYTPKQYDYLEIYRQVRQPILREQFDRLLKRPRL